MTYVNLGVIGKSIAHNMVERDKKSLMKECKENNLPYNKIKELIHNDEKIISFTIKELIKIQKIFNINCKTLQTIILTYSDIKFC